MLDMNRLIMVFSFACSGNKQLCSRDVASYSLGITIDGYSELQSSVQKETNYDVFCIQSQSGESFTVFIWTRNHLSKENLICHIIIISCCHFSNCQNRLNIENIIA